MMCHEPSSSASALYSELESLVRRMAGLLEEMRVKCGGCRGGACRFCRKYRRIPLLLQQAYDALNREDQNNENHNSNNRRGTPSGRAAPE